MTNRPQSRSSRLADVIKPAFFDDITKDAFSPQQAWIPLQLVECWIETLAKVGTVRLERVEGLVKEVGKEYADIEGGWKDDVGNVLGWINHDRSLFRPQKRNKEDNIDNARVETGRRVDEEFQGVVLGHRGPEADHRARLPAGLPGLQAEAVRDRPAASRALGKPCDAAAPPERGRTPRGREPRRSGRVRCRRGQDLHGRGHPRRRAPGGLGARPMIVVPNSIVWNWVAELALALPDYRVGVIGANRKIISQGGNKGKHTSETDTPEERAEKWTRFQAGEFDVMLVTY